MPCHYAVVFWIFYWALALSVATYLCFPFYSFFFWKMSIDFLLFLWKIAFERWQWGKHSAVKNKAYHNLKRWKKARVCVSQYACCAVVRLLQIKQSAMQWNNAVCNCHRHLGYKKLMPFYSCTAEMGGGERGKKRGQGVGEKKDGFRYPKNISVGIVRWDIFSGSGLWHWLFYIMLL